MDFFFLFFPSCFTSMCNHLGCDRLLNVFYTYIDISAWFITPFFALPRRSHFATFGLYHPESYPPLLLNRSADFPLLRRFSAPTRAPFAQTLPYSRFLCFSKILTAFQLLAHLLASLLAISFPAWSPANALLSQFSD